MTAPTLHTREPLPARTSTAQLIDSTPLALVPRTGYAETVSDTGLSTAHPPAATGMSIGQRARLLCGAVAIALGIILTAALSNVSSYSQATTAATGAVSAQQAFNAAQATGSATDEQRQAALDAAKQWQAYAELDASGTIDAYLRGDATANEAHAVIVGLHDVTNAHVALSATIGVLTALGVWLIGLLVCQKIWPVRRI